MGQFEIFSSNWNSRGNFLQDPKWTTTLRLGNRACSYESEGHASESSPISLKLTSVLLSSTGPNRRFPTGTGNLKPEFQVWAAVPASVTAELGFSLLRLRAWLPRCNGSRSAVWWQMQGSVRRCWTPCPDSGLRLPLAVGVPGTPFRCGTTVCSESSGDD